ncbi:VOC family protein [Phenylobacterium sp. LjRoot225]|uniref:VOC family protein n=1 Tax=Phenylobacterium sp. LjRoot225 TaxID=3342285 RepID=UPI003ECF77D4
MSSVLEAETPVTAPTKSGVVAYLNVDGALAAAEFYKKAFGAELAAQQPADDQGRTMHVHLYVNGSSVMLSDFYPEHGQPKVAPQGFSLVLIARDIHAEFQRAVDAGCEVVTPVQQMFWGDLFGALRDPYGVSWAMNQAAK